jgi:hypothetical protein
MSRKPSLLSGHSHMKMRACSRDFSIHHANVTRHQGVFIGRGASFREEWRLCYVEAPSSAVGMLV